MPLLRTSPLFGMFAALLLCAIPTTALAGDTVLAPSPALACLTLPAGGPDRPDYPAESLNRKEGGVVRVQLEFRDPERSPRVTLVRRSGIRALDDVVSEHVEQYRVPCMQAAGGPVTLLREYSFDPDGRSRVVASPPRDSADPARAAQMSCMRHTVADAKPVYPRQALRMEQQGVLLVKLRFTAPDLPPAMEWIAATPHQGLRNSVEEFAAGLRLPCLDKGPVEVLRAYRFLLSGGPRTVLRDSTLVNFLRTGKDLAKPVFFDFNAMSCPFDVRLTYSRPFARNVVQQLDTRNPARQPLLDWLAGVTLNFSDAQQLEVFGYTMIVSVPCGTLEL
ncbi:hypothetical protein [Massilia sp. TWR1-2-2]|uniref:hypothetical protein n=1 Tax=Massilia sp. TWR1-2-2 TaxID=2804584 RepID=UPI003CE9C283